MIVIPRQVTYGGRHGSLPGACGGVRTARFAVAFDDALKTLMQLDMERIPELWTASRYARAEVYYDMEEFGDAADDVPRDARGMNAENPRGMPQEDARWKSALEADVAYGYRQFMQDYPESIHNEQAQLHLDRLDDDAWARASEA